MSENPHVVELVDRSDISDVDFGCALFPKQHSESSFLVSSPGSMDQSRGKDEYRLLTQTEMHDFDADSLQPKPLLGVGDLDSFFSKVFLLSRFHFSYFV